MKALRILLLAIASALVAYANTLTEEKPCKPSAPKPSKPEKGKPSAESVKQAQQALKKGEAVKTEVIPEEPTLEKVEKTVRVSKNSAPDESSLITERTALNSLRTMYKSEKKALEAFAELKDKGEHVGTYKTYRIEK